MSLKPIRDEIDRIDNQLIELFVQRMKCAEKVAAYKGLSHKDALHLRLLAEEMLGMMRSITGEKEGSFWIEDDKGVYSLHLKVNTSMNSEKREQLLSASTSGTNAAAKGIMGRLRDFFDRGADDDVIAWSSPLLTMGEYDSSSVMDYEWTMMNYQEELAQRVARKEADAVEAWDELEKSVVAHAADNVIVSIRGRDVEMTLVKKLG